MCRVAAVALLLLLPPPSTLDADGMFATAFSSYRERIPNGYSVPSRRQYTFMAVGHIDAFKGGLPLNRFGVDFREVGFLRLLVHAPRPDTHLSAAGQWRVLGPRFPPVHHRRRFPFSPRPAGLQANMRWTAELCQLDSDQDGQSNGVELGDPCCEWTVEAIPRSLPRDAAESHHPHPARAAAHPHTPVTRDGTTARSPDAQSTQGARSWDSSSSGCVWREDDTQDDIAAIDVRHVSNTVGGRRR